MTRKELAALKRRNARLRRNRVMPTPEQAEALRTLLANAFAGLAVAAELRENEAKGLLPVTYRGRGWSVTEATARLTEVLT